MPQEDKHQLPAIPEPDLDLKHFEMPATADGKPISAALIQSVEPQQLEEIAEILVAFKRRNLKDFTEHRSDMPRARTAFYIEEMLSALNKRLAELEQQVSAAREASSELLPIITLNGQPLTKADIDAIKTPGRLEDLAIALDEIGTTQAKLVRTYVISREKHIREERSRGKGFEHIDNALNLKKPDEPEISN